MMNLETIDLDSAILNECLREIPPQDGRDAEPKTGSIHRIVHILSTPYARVCPQA